MKIIGFNHQMSGRDRDVFSDATQEKGRTLCASRLHSGSKKRVIKVIALSILLLFSFSSKQKVQSQTCQRFGSKATNDRFLLGDSLVADTTFPSQVNSSCVTGKDGCILEKLSINYYSILSRMSRSALKLDKTHQLSLKIYKKKNSTEEHISAYVLLSVNNVVTDSILCYEYYNNANTLSCYEQIYYINIRQRKIWTVMMTFDEESAQADDANTYLIDLRTNRFRKEDGKNEQDLKGCKR
ncbi:hypothetical protein [Prevotella jejuni]|jgi:putative uncharacterized protein (fragment)|uniref:hypothetical protein n=1 Tax=Prevotella jejuni TaxID=1177574 RepID=UPI00352F267C